MVTEIINSLWFSVALPIFTAITSTTVTDWLRKNKRTKDEKKKELLNKFKLTAISYWGFEVTAAKSNADYLKSMDSYKSTKKEYDALKKKVFNLKPKELAEYAKEFDSSQRSISVAQSVNRI